LVLHLAADCYDMGRARRAERILNTLGDTCVITQQDASEERRLQFGDAKRLRDDVLGARLERIQSSERRKALIARQHTHICARHDRIDVLAGKVLAIREITRVGWRLEFALSADVVAVAKIGERWRLNEHRPFHRSRYTLTEIGDEEMIRLDAQVGVRIAHVRLADDDAFNYH
jgi:hypothetical protein